MEFVLLAFGGGMDCPSGCIFSDYCAIVDDGKDYPYSFYFLKPDYDFLGVGTHYSQDLPDKSLLTGRSHRLTSLVQFWQFLGKQREPPGQFYFCLD